MHTRSYVAKVGAVLCSLVLTSAYIYFRSNSLSAYEEETPADSDPQFVEANKGLAPFAKDDTPAGAQATANAKQAKMMMGGTKSAAVFTLLDGQGRR